MNIYDLLPTFKVVEINNVVGLRSGHIIAQAVMAKADYADGSQDYVQNGYILYLDVDGNLKSPGNVNAAVKQGAPVLHYTEELFTGISEELKHFAVEWNADDECYPRGLVLALNDAFTTNNFTGTIGTATVASVDDNGVLKVYDNMTALDADNVGYVGPVFNVIESTLPDGVTAAGEFTLVVASYTV